MALESTRKAFETEAKTLSSLALQEPAEAKARRVAQEEAYAKLRGELGKPEEADPAQPAPYAAPDVSPDAWVDFQKGTSEFKTMSALTRTAQALATRSGPEWDSLTQSVTGPIIEGSAAMLRDQSELLRNEFARGGLRRSQAREAMLKIRNIESANVTRQQQLWNANLALTQWGTQFANEQITQYNKLYAENTGGIRDSFNNAMDKAGALLVNSAIPMALTSGVLAAQSATARATEDRAKRQRTYGIAGGALAALTGAVIGGPLGAQLMTGGIGAAGASALPGMGFEQMTQPQSLLGSASKQLFGGLLGGGGTDFAGMAAGSRGSGLEALSGGESSAFNTLMGNLTGGRDAEQGPGLADRMTQGPLAGPVRSLFGIGEPGAGLAGQAGGAVKSFFGIGEEGMGTLGDIGGGIKTMFGSIKDLFGFG